MAPLTLEMPHDSEGAIECWDDDDDLQCYEDIHLRAASSAASVTTSSIRRSGHRDSISSRLSARSDLDSTAGGDEDWQIQLLDDNELVDEEAISSVKNAGIPLPANVPRSALIGGTIKRLGKRKTKREFIDDWSDDLELPGPDVALELKRFPDTSFPEAFPQLNSATGSPVKPASPSFNGDVTRQLSIYTNSDSFTDNIDTDSTLDVPTIKAPSQRSSLLPSLLGDSMPMPTKEQISTDNFDDDFELPTGDFLQLRHPSAQNSSPAPEDLDVDWSEGSIGVRFGGTARDHHSNPSSSISVVSPSASSYLTGESDDEGLDGLVIPEGPLDLETEQSGAEDFFSGLEINNGEAFNFKKPSINPNIKCKTEPLGSPARRSATTLTFTNASVSPKTRIPRLSGHERPLSTHLETVSESGAPLSKFRTSPRRPGHVSHSSVSSLPVSTSTTLSSSPFTPSRRLVGTRISKESSSGERGAGKQLLKPKRSMPSMRNPQQTTPTTSLHSPPRSQGGTGWSTSRLWTAVDRTANSPAVSMRKSQTPFLPAGASDKQSHHASIKNYRYSRRTSSDSNGDTFGSQGPVIRLSRSSRHEHPGFNNGVASEKLSSTPKRTLTRPTRRRNYGDGSELASFDDLPTSTATESRFVKQPSGRGAPRSLRNKLSQSQPTTSKLEGPPQEVPAAISPALHHQQPLVPRFARDTNASRIAREQRIASMSSIPKLRENTPLTPLSSNWKPQNISRVPSTAVSLRNKKGKSGSMSSARPQLIKPIGAGVQEAKSVNGMHYNPASFRWEGNENLVRGFESGTPKSPKPSPALITNVGAMQNVQVVGGMVFDPQRMCWLKLAPSQPGIDGVVAVEDEDDVFSNLVDLGESGAPGKKVPGTLEDSGPTGSGDDRSGEDSSDEWPITEEFDVGPEFIRRQHTEEEKWRRKVDKWINHNHAGFGSNWRWAIRDLVRFNSALGAQELNTA
ncbi:hypothetical protein BJY01DRAFT_226151 [Aspergillus pseudoustus]|uniref:Cytokinesis regulator n=1 Tax=Aspergillus pseudoustus TaxID=1810923 RepID=A0ABR4IWT3_9EURO